MPVAEPAAASGAAAPCQAQATAAKLSVQKFAEMQAKEDLATVAVAAKGLGKSKGAAAA